MKKCLEKTGKIVFFQNYLNKTHLDNLAIKVIFWWKSTKYNGLAQSPDIATGVSQTQHPANPSTSAAITAGETGKLNEEEIKHGQWMLQFIHKFITFNRHFYNTPSD